MTVAWLQMYIQLSVFSVDSFVMAKSVLQKSGPPGPFLAAKIGTPKPFLAECICH